MRSDSIRGFDATWSLAVFLLDTNKHTYHHAHTARPTQVPPNLMASPVRGIKQAARSCCLIAFLVVAMFEAC